MLRSQTPMFWGKSTNGNLGVYRSRLLDYSSPEDDEICGSAAYQPATTTLFRLVGSTIGHADDVKLGSSLPLYFYRNIGDNITFCDQIGPIHRPGRSILKTQPSSRYVPIVESNCDKSGNIVLEDDSSSDQSLDQLSIDSSFAYLHNSLDQLVGKYLFNGDGPTHKTTQQDSTDEGQNQIDKSDRLLSFEGQIPKTILPDSDSNNSEQDYFVSGHCGSGYDSALAPSGVWSSEDLSQSPEYQSSFDPFATEDEGSLADCSQQVKKVVRDIMFNGADCNDPQWASDDEDERTMRRVDPNDLEPTGDYGTSSLIHKNDVLNFRTIEKLVSTSANIGDVQMHVFSSNNDALMGEWRQYMIRTVRNAQLDHPYGRTPESEAEPGESCMMEAQSESDCDEMVLESPLSLPSSPIPSDSQSICLSDDDLDLVSEAFSRVNPEDVASVLAPAVAAVADADPAVIASVVAATALKAEPAAAAPVAVSSKSRAGRRSAAIAASRAFARDFKSEAQERPRAPSRQTSKKRRLARATDSESEANEKRLQHNEMERRRRIGLRNLLNDLKCMIPQTADKSRASKMLILQEAVRFCRSLISDVEQTTQRIERKKRHFKTKLMPRVSDAEKKLRDLRWERE